MTANKAKIKGLAEEAMIELDPSTLDELAALIAGDGDRPVYRSGQKIREFLTRAGISSLPDFSAMHRREATRQALNGHYSDMSNAERAVLRLADRREYPSSNDAYHDTLRELGEILSAEGLQVVHDDRGRPGITTVITSQVEARLHDVQLKVTLDQVIGDPELIAVAQERLNEARACHEAGAYMAAIIMLGSLLEGALIAAAQERPHEPLPRPIERTSLQELIKLAHKHGWIQFDAQLGADLVRQYRNLVHPHLQLREIGHLPDADTLDMCWPVVNATLNDLAATRRNPRP